MLALTYANPCSLTVNYMSHSLAPLHLITSRFSSTMTLQKNKHQMLYTLKFSYKYTEDLSFFFSFLSMFLSVSMNAINLFSIKNDIIFCYLSCKLLTSRARVEHGSPLVYFFKDGG